jgi:pimeloyl-ACP methyl ester carboxylesterase
MSDVATPSGHLRWDRTTVAGRAACYGTAGEGLPVVFLHGWALGQHAYKRALKRVANLGCHVVAPALPGFGGTADLPEREVSYGGYAEWVAELLSVLGLDEPVLLVGHSFGGGVATKLAHSHPELVRSLVLVNSVGGPAWSSGGRPRTMAERPLLDWLIHLPLDAFPLEGALRLLPAVAEDAVPNVMCNPLGLWRAGRLARRADLTRELADLARSDLPVLAVSAAKDTVIPKASFDALCAAAGREGRVVPGRHAWMLSDPEAFADLLAGAILEAQALRTPQGA